MKQPRKTSATSEGNWLVLSRAPHKLGVIERKGTTVEQRFIKALYDDSEKNKIQSVAPMYRHRSHYKCQAALNTFCFLHVYLLWSFCLSF